MNEQHESDEQILSAIERRLSAVEPLVPVPPAWHPAAEAGGAGAPLRPRVRSNAFVGLGLGGLTAAVALAVLLALALGPLRFGGPAGNGAASPSPSTSPSPSAASAGGRMMVFRVVVPAGWQGSKTPLVGLDDAISTRLKAAGSSNFVLAGGGAPQAPEELVDPGIAPDTARALLEQRGVLQFVPLPRAVYGYVETGNGASYGAVAGSKPVPSEGDDIAPAISSGQLSALLDNASFERTKFAAAVNPPTGGWVVDFQLTPAAAATFAAYTSANVGDYFAIVLDGVVVSAPYIAAPVAGGAGEIAGNFTAQSAQRLGFILASGPLPFELRYLGLEPAGSATP